MIKKIIKIVNVGRFENYSASGDVELKKINAIFAENGRGKTTISAIFRSLKNNEPVFISERKTLGAEGDPEVEILIDTQTYKFKTHWGQGYTDIEIFDSVFVDKNVFSGEHVEHDHKRNLYRFVVGENGVNLALKVDELDKNIRDKNGEITEKKLTLQKCIIGSSLEIEQFLQLENIVNVKELIKGKEKEIEVIKKAKLIESKPLLQKLILPVYPATDIEGLLGKTLADISTGAEDRTKKHIKEHLDREGEEWLQKGLMYMQEDCPFCGQSLDENSLIEAYKKYFDATYSSFKEEIKILGVNFKKSFAETSLLYIQKLYNSNDSLLEFWKEYVGEQPILDLSFEEIESAWRELYSQALENIRRKYLSPLEKVPIGDELGAAINAYFEIQKKVKIYNEVVEGANELIQKKKLAASGGEVPTATQELEKLQNIVVRHQKETDVLCDGYKNLLQEKIDLEKKKKKAKDELNQFTDDVFNKYQESINKYLKSFGAGFEIVQTTTGFAGGKPSSNYCIKINEVSIDVGDTRAYGKPCFRNILSQGDKNSLAFAFFLAKLEQDENLSNKVVIFDDPINSLDGHRKSCTEQEIVKIAQKSKQCIVMSHDKYFLRAVWSKGASDEVKSLQLIRNGHGSQIMEWEILADTKGSYFDDFYTLIKFQDEGATDDRQRRSIVRSIRPVLEGYMRIKFPKVFLEGWWLGQFITHVDESVATELQTFKTNVLQELKDINDYSKKYHHSDNQNADSETINETELNTYISRTLSFMNE